MILSSSTTMIAAVMLLLISGQMVDACFLNSCPYRRYGRTLRCSSCGPYSEGVCVDDQNCCTNELCYATSECNGSSFCPELFCKINRNPGYCLKKGYCCTAEGCEQSAMC